MNRIKFREYLPAFLILILLLAFSAFAFYEASLSAQSRRSKLFELRVNQSAEAITSRMIDYAQILRGAQGFFYASDTITKTDWKKYIEILKLSDTYPGILGTGYSIWLNEEEKNTLEETMKNQGYANFKVRPSIRRDVYTSIIYLEPFKGRNLRAFGFDMYSDSVRREAMEKSRRTGRATLTGKVILKQETGKDVQAGFLLYLPIYNNYQNVKSEEDRLNSIKGFVYNPFRAKDLMSSVLKKFSDIDVELYDGPVAREESLLYNSDTVYHLLDESNLFEFRKDTVLNVFGRSWALHITSGSRFGSTIENRQPFMILIFGVSISILLFIISIYAIKRRRNIIRKLEIIKELESKKDEFISIASHELKTPLTSIKAYMQLLERSALGPGEKKYVAKASSHISKLNYLISDLLDVSKIQAGKLQFNVAPFKLQELIDEGVENVRHMYSTHEIIKPESIPDITLIGDKFRLEQVLTNFLTNAIKYSPHSDKVIVRTILSETYVCIEVEDFGIGIDQENHERLFERFYRVQGLAHNFTGLGMGLYISAEMVKRHNGVIGVRSEPGKGSVFYFSLPLKQSREIK